MLLFPLVFFCYPCSWSWNLSLNSLRNMMSAAAQCYKATLSVTTGLSAPFNNLAIIYKQQVQCHYFSLTVEHQHLQNFRSSFIWLGAVARVLVNDIKSSHTFWCDVDKKAAANFVCLKYRVIMEMQYLATMRSSELIHQQLMALWIGETLTKKLGELMKQSKTMFVL